MDTEKKRLTFGVIIDIISSWDISDYYQTIIISGVADYAKENDINVICFLVGRLGSHNEWERSSNLLINFIQKNKVDGLIILPTTIGIFESEEKVRKILEDFGDLPIVTLTENYGKYHTIRANNYIGFNKVVSHVIEEHNRTRLAYIGGPKNNRESQERFQAFLDSLKEHGVPYYPELTFEGDFLFDSGNSAVKYLLENKMDFDAIICANDNMAVGALNQLHRQLGRIPDNLSITGFDDSETSRFHALTTVKQPFYEQAREAAVTLHKLLKGEEVLWTTEFPSEVIIRSSCGCIGSGMKNTDISLNSQAADCKDDDYENVRRIIISELKEINNIISKSSQEQVLKYENSVIEACYDELFRGHNKEFIKNWNNFVMWIILERNDITSLLDILTCIRKNILSKLVTEEKLVAAENLFHEANLVSCEAIQRTGASLSYLSFLQTEGLVNFAEDLVGHLDWKLQMDYVCKTLPDYNIHGGYIALYEDDNQPLKNARLILGFDGKDRINVGDKGIVFPTLDLLPGDIMQELKKDRFNLIIMALNQGNNPLGYGVFRFENKVTKFYELVRYYISVALKGALLVDNIKNQALDLEKQVEERTLKLLEMNQALLNEIKLRKDAQDQLSKAMKELKLYNSKLKTESIKDELTGLYNRRGFMKMTNEILDLEITNPTEFLLLFGDLDDLKKINDQFGHTEGDFAIKKTAELLNQTFHNTDIVARISGDEFLVVIPEASMEDEPILRKKMQDNCNRYNTSSQKPYIITLSMGFAYYDPENPNDIEALLKEADIALYKEKLKKNSRLSNRFVD